MTKSIGQQIIDGLQQFNQDLRSGKVEEVELIGGPCDGQIGHAYTYKNRTFAGRIGGDVINIYVRTAQKTAQGRLIFHFHESRRQHA